MGAVSLTKQTKLALDSLLPLWTEQTKTENQAALVARSVVDALLDLVIYVDEFDKLDTSKRTERIGT